MSITSKVCVWNFVKLIIRVFYVLFSKSVLILDRIFLSYFIKILIFYDIDFNSYLPQFFV